MFLLIIKLDRVSFETHFRYVCVSNLCLIYLWLELEKENFRPVNNLQLLSKFTEKVVAEQMASHIMAYGLFLKLQSAYWRFHSTKTALLRVRNDILLNMNRRHVTLQVCLNLSAAFETIGHTILLQRLESNFGSVEQLWSGFARIYWKDFNR